MNANEISPKVKESFCFKKLSDRPQKAESKRQVELEGRREWKIETAKNLLKMDIDLEVIMKATDFSKKKLLEIKEDQNSMGDLLF